MATTRRKLIERAGSVTLVGAAAVVLGDQLSDRALACTDPCCSVTVCGGPYTRCQNCVEMECIDFCSRLNGQYCTTECDLTGRWCCTPS
jgi:hypothetical protein